MGRGGGEGGKLREQGAGGYMDTEISKYYVYEIFILWHATVCRLINKYVYAFVLSVV